jgi:large subunit ribosomal protein L31
MAGFAPSRYNEISRKDSMKAGIHPAYEEVSVTCACGNTFKTRSTHKGDIRVEICSNCHPFFTGRQKLVDTEGRVDRFQKKFQRSKAIQEVKTQQKANKAAKKQPVG